MKEAWWQISWLHVLSPLLVVIVGATLVLLLTLGQRSSCQCGSSLRWVGLSALLLALGLIIVRNKAPIESVLAQAYRWDTLTMIFTGALLVMAIISLLFSLHRPLAWEGEWVAVLLFAVGGGGLAIGATDFISLFVGLELFGLSTYILVGLQKGSRFTSEAAWKYLITGGVATAVFLYGVSFLAGYTGKTSFAILQKYIMVMVKMGSVSNVSWILLSFLLVFIGLALKLALVPFHSWAPDVYRGSSSPMLVWLLVGVKVTLLAILLRLVTLVYQPAFDFFTELGYQAVPWLIFGLALLTIVIGNVASLFQERVKSAFAYASLAQGGYLLLPFSNNDQSMIESVSSLTLSGSVSLVLYMIAYALVVFGGLAIIEAVTAKSDSEGVEVFAGLIHRSPLMALAMTGFLFSAAGIPFLTAGFFAKFYLLVNVLTTNGYRLMLFLLVTLFSYLAYFRILRQIFFRPSADSRPVYLPWNLSFVVIASIAGTLLLGFFPGGASRFVDLEDWIRSGSWISGGPG